MAESSSETMTALIEEISVNRHELQAHRLGLRRASSPADRLKRSFHEHKAVFFGSAVILGLLLSLLPRGREDKVSEAIQQPYPGSRHRDLGNSPKTHPVAAAVGVTFVKLALDAAKPILFKWLKERALNHPHPAVAVLPPQSEEDTLP